MSAIFNEISLLLQQGRVPAIQEKISSAIEDGFGAKDILDNGLLAGMSIIGEKFKKNQVFIPEVMIAARAMNAGMALLKPLLTETTGAAKGVVVIGTVKGDMHDIGKNLCKMMLEGKGLKVIDLGVDVSAAKFLASAQENNAKIICCSALLTTTMGEMKQVVDAAASSALAGKIKIMIGGAPVTQAYCTQIGADRYTPDAATCAEVALELCG